MLGVRSFAVVLVLAACGPSAAPTSNDLADAGDDDLCPGGVCVNACPAGTSTTLTGRVMAPNGIDPMPFAQVYLPRSLQPFPAGVSCEVCSEVGGDALIKTTTAVDGTFTLGPIPTKEGQASGVEIDVVVQKGRFRKVSKAVIESPCGANDATAASTTLPGKADGMNSVPKIAVATGDYDVMECVLLDFGLDPSAFDLYNGIRDPLFGLGTPDTLGDLDTLLNSAEKMKQYNIIFLNCSNNEFEDQLDNATVRQNIEAYAAAGGRLYVTDWSYDYVEQIPEFASVIDFAPDASDAAPEGKNLAAVGTGGIELQGTVEDPDLRAWLEAVERSTGDEIIDDAGTVHIEHFLSEWVMQLSVPTGDTTKVWITGDGGSPLAGPHPLTTTFDYQECGRVLYSSYHTGGRGGDAFDPDALRFPNYCADDGLLPQERILMYLVSHVADCIGDVVD